MRRLGLDIGEARVGVAVSDPSGRVATPLTVLPGRSPGLATEVRRLVEDLDVAEVVVGLPLSMDGTEGRQAAAVRVTAAELARVLPVPVTFWDERLSTSEARRVLSGAGVKDGSKRERVDKVAAALILQGYLDAQSGQR